MKKFTKLLFLPLLVLLSWHASGQTVLINPNAEGGFESGATFGDNGWTVVNTANANASQWHIATAPLTNGTVTFTPTGSRAAYAAKTAGTWMYNTSPAAGSSHFYRDVTFPAGETNVNLSFNWIANGESTWDILYVYMCPTTLTPAANSPSSSTNTVSWTGTGTATLLGSYNLITNGVTQSANVNINPALVGNCTGSSTMRLVFTWKNDGGGGSEPPAAVDNISLTSAAPQSLIDVAGGTYTIDNTQAAGGTNFTSFTSAINNLNAAAGCGLRGAVTFNVASGQTFAENPPAITVSGDATNDITFQKSGGGANPKITPTGTASTSDFGICISGGDYITFDGIDIEGITSGSNVVEYGYLVRNGSATNGAQYNLIQNATITMNNRSSSSSTIGGILMSSTTTGGGVVPTALSGTNAYNDFMNINIRKSASGIMLIGGSTTFRDTLNEVGTLAPNIYNEIGGDATDSLGSSATSYGIYAINQASPSIHHNLVRNIVSSTTVYGIFVSGGFGDALVYNNKVHTLRTSGAFSTMFGINVAQSTTTGLVNSTRVYNNFVSNLFCASAASSTTTVYTQGLTIGTGNATSEFIAVNNNVWIASNSLTAQSAALQTGGSTAKYTIQNNNLANTTGAQTGTNFHVGILTSAAASFGAAGSVCNYNNIYVPNTTNGLIAHHTTTFSTVSNRKATLAEWQASFGGTMDANGMTVDPGYNNATDLHTSGAGINGTGATPPTWLTTDIDEEALTVPYDVGADQFTPASLDMGATALVNPSVSACNNATQGVVVTIKNFALGSINFATNPITVTCNVTGAATATLSATVNTGTLAGGATQNVTLTGTINMSASGTYNFALSTSVAGDGNASNDAANESRTIAPTIAIPYSQNFDVSSVPADWTQTGWLFSTTTHGVSGGGAYVNLDNAGEVATLTSPKLGTLSATDRLFFDYRLVDWSGYPTTATPNTSDWGNVKVQISTDCGATFTDLEVINNTNHVSSLSWVTKQYSLAAYAGQTAIFRIIGTYLAGDYFLDIDNFMVSANCSGTPTAGAVTGVPASGICAGAAVTLSNSTMSTTAGVTYQWQQSINGTDWTNIAGATATSVNVTPFVNMSYRFVATCGGSGLSSNTTPAQVTVNTNAYATVPHTEDFESWTTRCSSVDSLDAPSIFWTTTPTTGNNSWRRNDQGASGSWTALTSYAYTPGFSTGAASARFHSGNILAGTKGLMHLFVNLSGSGDKQLAFDYINTSGTDSVRVLLSLDNGLTFTQAGSTLRTAAAWTRQFFTLSANNATAIVRIEATADFGSTDIGIDNLTVTAPCNATPTAGTISGASSACPNSPILLSSTGTSTGGGITYQWQQSTNGTDWTNIVGATALTHNATLTTQSLQFRLAVTCSGISSTVYTNTLPVTLNAPAYATLPYTQNFETWTTTCASGAFTNDVPGNEWRANPTSGNNAWRRNDATTTTSGWSSTFGAYTPASSLGTYSARFHSYDVQSRAKGTMDLYINLTGAGTKQLAFDYINTSGTDSLRVLLSEDGGVTFTQVDTSVKTASAWSRKAYNINSTSTTAVIRLEATGDFGATDIGVDNLTVTTPCTGTPTAGTVQPSASTVCANSTVTLSSTGATAGAGIAYQWQQSANGTDWTDIAAATSTSYTSNPITQATQFRLAVTCTNSSSTVYTPSVAIALNNPTYATLPYSQGFETWTTGCATGAFSADIPGNEWRGTPTSGNNSWRRNDITTAASGWTGTLGAYSPTFTQGANSARFHSYNATSGTVGTLDLYANLSGDGSKVISFDYINPTGTDSLFLQISEDGGTTFTNLAARGASAAWTRISANTASTSSTAIIRLRAKSDFGDDDIGVDNFKLFVVPTGGTTSTTTPILCGTTAATINLNNAATHPSVARQWQSSPDSTVWSDVAAATGTSHNATLTATTFYRVKVSSLDSVVYSTATKITVGTVPTPSIVASGNTTFCQGDSVRLTARGGATYGWSTNATDSVITVRNGATYTVTVTNAQGCTATTSQVVTVNALPTPSIVASGNTTFCQGDSVRLTARGGATYRWSTNATDSVITARNGATYAVTVTNAQGCTASASQVVTVNPKPTVSFTTNIVGGRVTFTNTSTNGATYRWNFGNVGDSTSLAQNPVFTYTANGNYTVRLLVTSAAGCKDSTSQIINVTRVGVKELRQDITVKIYPNPTSEMVYLEFDDNSLNVLGAAPRIIVTNAQGQVVTDMPFSGKNVAIEAERWANGLYFINLRINGTMIQLEKVIKQ